jgi:hypothetical protein
LARRFGRRLNRAYGWTSDLFVREWGDLFPGKLQVKSLNWFEKSLSLGKWII